MMNPVCQVLLLIVMAAIQTRPARAEEQQKFVGEVMRTAGILKHYDQFKNVKELMDLVQSEAPTVHHLITDGVTYGVNSFHDKMSHMSEKAARFLDKSLSVAKVGAEQIKYDFNGLDHPTKNEIAQLSPALTKLVQSDIVKNALNEVKHYAKQQQEPTGQETVMKN